MNKYEAELNHADDVVTNTHEVESQAATDWRHARLNHANVLVFDDTSANEAIFVKCGDGTIARLYPIEDKDIEERKRVYHNAQESSFWCDPYHCSDRGELVGVITPEGEYISKPEEV